jgi:hypothetical protein
MNLTPDSITDRLWRALILVLATAFVAYVAWRLLSPLLPLLVVVVGLLTVYRLALGTVRRRRGW